MPQHLQPLRIFVEGLTDEAIVVRLLQTTGISQYDITVAGGKSTILKKLAGYNQAARFGGNWLVVLDLDQSAECVPEYLYQILPDPSTRMNLRLAVRASEAWLMADCEEMERFIGVKSRFFPLLPDEERDPKQFLVNLIAKRCRNKQMKRDMLPEPGSSRRQGPGFADILRRFAIEHWRPEIAARNSDSLARCIRALEELKRQSDL